MPSSNSSVAVCVLLAFLAFVGYVQAQTYPGCSSGTTSGPMCICGMGKVHSTSGCIDFAAAAMAAGIQSGTRVNIDVFAIAQTTTRIVLLDQTIDSTLSLDSLTGTVTAVTVIWKQSNTRRVGRPLLVLSAGALSADLNTLILADWRNIIQLSAGSTSMKTKLAISLNFMPGAPSPPGLKIEQRRYSDVCYSTMTRPPSCTYSEFMTGSELAFGDYEFHAYIGNADATSVTPLTVPFRVSVQAWNARNSQPQCLHLSNQACLCITGYAFLKNDSCAPAGQVLIDEGQAAADQEMELQVFSFNTTSPPTGSAKKRVDITAALTLPELAFGTAAGYVVVGDRGRSVVASFASLQARQLVSSTTKAGYTNTSRFIRQDPDAPGMVILSAPAPNNNAQYRKYSASCYGATAGDECAWLNLDTSRALSIGDYELLLFQREKNESTYLLPPFPFSVSASSSDAHALPSAFLMLVAAVGVLVF
eukprot:scpid39523/ scgid14570/ 